MASLYKQLTRTELEQMKVKDLRNLARDRGYGIMYLSQRKKEEIIDKFLAIQNREGLARG